MYGRDYAMQLWRSSEHLNCVAAESHDGGWPFGGEHHGQLADRERAAVWHVLVACESNCGGCDLSRARRFDAHALRSGFTGAVGAGRTDRVDWRNAGAK